MLVEAEPSFPSEPLLKMPPAGPLGGTVLLEACLASWANFSNVLPDSGALIAPTIPADV